MYNLVVSYDEFISYKECERVRTFAGRITTMDNHRPDVTLGRAFLIALALLTERLSRSSRFMAYNEHFDFPISHTDRPMAEGEVEALHHLFISPAESPMTSLRKRHFITWTVPPLKWMLVL